MEGPVGPDPATIRRRCAATCLPTPSRPPGAREEGKVAAPECGHGIRAAIDDAPGAKETGDERVILFHCGHGLLELSAYDDLNNHRLVDG